MECELHCSMSSVLQHAIQVVLVPAADQTVLIVKAVEKVLSTMKRTAVWASFCLV